MKLLIIGHKGQLGQDLMKIATARGFTAIGADLPQWDITNAAGLDQCFDGEKDLDVVINSAAYTAVDNAESDADMAFTVNRDGAANVAKACAQRNLALVQISTDYVFDGSIIRPLIPSDTIHPLNVYGQSKAEGEVAVRRELAHHVIIRTSWLFGSHGNNFVKTMLRLGKEREELRLVDDQVGCPTYTGDLAAAILTVASQIMQKKDIWGTYHFCNEGALTWYAFARRIFSLARSFDTFIIKKIVPILARQFPVAALRPQYSVLDCTDFDKVFMFRRRPYDEALREMLMLHYR